MNGRQTLKSLYSRARYLGWRRFCPVCRGYASSFKTFGPVSRPEARCPYCGSLERHRLAWLFFERRTSLWSTPRKRMLHFAPEACFAPKFQDDPSIDWLSADLLNPAMVKMDITQIEYPDNSFDVVYCSHVLEHVPDDRTALRELVRVLRPTGWAVVLVPITREATYEDASIVAPAERERAFGQWDHVRRYGRDFSERLAEAGFTVTTLTASDFASPAEIERMRLNPLAQLFFCRKG